MSAKSGVHIWSLQKRLQEFINADNGVKFQSGVFPVGDFGWQIIAYPNGNRFENYGSVMIYLRLISYPASLPHGGVVTINFRIQCHETYSSSTFIETYFKANDSKGWSSKNLLLSDLTKESINKITFQVDVKILKIINNYNKITYETPLKIYKSRYGLKWIVNPNLYHRFQYANNGKWFESGNYSNLWCFKCAPNGYNDKNIGSCILFIQLCALPPNIDKIKCKVKLFHVESDTKWTVKKDFGYDTKNAGWTKNKLLFDKMMTYDTITFRAEIDILGLYDLNGNKSTLSNLSNNNYKYKAKITRNSRTQSNTFYSNNYKNKNKTRNNRSASINTQGFGNNEFGNNYKNSYNPNSTNFPSSYKRNKSQSPKYSDKKQNDDDDDDGDSDDSDNDNDDDDSEYITDSSSSSDEIALNNEQEMLNQLKIILKQWKKLHKTMNDLKLKSTNNDNKIKVLKKQIAVLKKKNKNKSIKLKPVPVNTVYNKKKNDNINNDNDNNIATPWADHGVVSPQNNNTTTTLTNANPFATNTTTASNGGGNDILDLFGDLNGNNNQPIQNNNNTQKAQNNNPNAFDAWEAF